MSCPHYRVVAAVVSCVEVQRKNVCVCLPALSVCVCSWLGFNSV